MVPAAGLDIRGIMSFRSLPCRWTGLSTSPHWHFF